MPSDGTALAPVAINFLAHTVLHAHARVEFGVLPEILGYSFNPCRCGTPTMRISS